MGCSLSGFKAGKSQTTAGGPGSNSEARKVVPAWALEKQEVPQRVSCLSGHLALSVLDNIGFL